MPEKDWANIQRNYLELLDQIDSNHLIDRLYSDVILDDDDYEEIWTLRSKSRLEAVRKLLDILRRRGPTAYGAFLTALTANGYPTVAQKLQHFNEDVILHRGTPFTIKIDTCITMYVMDSESRSIPLEPNPVLTQKIQACVKEAMPDLLPSIVCSQPKLNETGIKFKLSEISENLEETGDNPTNVTTHSLSVQSVIELIDLLEAFAGSREPIMVYFTKQVEKRSSLIKHKISGSISGLIITVHIIASLSVVFTPALIAISPISGLVVLIEGAATITSSVADIRRKVELSKLVKIGEELYKQIEDKLAIANLVIQSSTIKTTLKETGKAIISNIPHTLKLVREFDSVFDTDITKSSVTQLDNTKGHNAMDQLLIVTNSMNRRLAQLTQMIKDLKLVSEELKLQTNNVVSQ
ncbi:hypothetical protein SNE40_022061 [Patella caerulea]|uniref:CARD domain-containing protein n=1 Tax=Patella caerulea TaxID=87958 RepID=A0AAN8J0U6_PATCE